MNRRDHLLWILAEECAEVAQRASKAARFGVLEIQPGQKLNNSERLLGEIADICGVLDLLFSEKHIVMKNLMPRMHKMATAKRKKIEKFLKYSAKCGTLTL